MGTLDVAREGRRREGAVAAAGCLSACGAQPLTIDGKDGMNQLARPPATAGTARVPGGSSNAPSLSVAPVGGRSRRAFRRARALVPLRQSMPQETRSWTQWHPHGKCRASPPRHPRTQPGAVVHPSRHSSTSPLTPPCRNRTDKLRAVRGRRCSHAVGCIKDLRRHDVEASGARCFHRHPHRWCGREVPVRKWQAIGRITAV